jgi:diguanylate cyclase (GGDEF)-like protein
LVHQAYHDTLTGLPNRALLTQRLDAALAVTPVRDPFALLLLDLDDFKLINDTHGHGAGDLVLEAIARRLQRSVRSGDTVARLGGDEFAVLAYGGVHEAHELAARLVERIQEPVHAAGRRFVVRASAGVVPATRADETARSLMSHADIALYEAKDRGKGGVVVIDGAERADAAMQVYLREQIAQPDLTQFRVVYQPIVDLTDGRMRGVEALLRWSHPELGEVSPAEFVPLAEHGGSITVLGWHVLELTCAQLVEWQRVAPDHRLAIGVNVSTLQLDEPGFADRVVGLVAEHGFSPDQLVLELTEQALARDFDTAVSVVAQLRRAGISVAVDDFGTGYSSLRYLDRFDADVMKIDRSFVAALVESEDTRKIVASVLRMAESLDLQTIAEGIETPEQLAVMRALGCELAQGYLFSRPVPPERITELLHQGGHCMAAAPDSPPVLGLVGQRDGRVDEGQVAQPLREVAEHRA